MQTSQNKKHGLQAQAQSARVMSVQHCSQCIILWHYIAPMTCELRIKQKKKKKMQLREKSTQFQETGMYL